MRQHHLIRSLMAGACILAPVVGLRAEGHNDQPVVVTLPAVELSPISGAAVPASFLSLSSVGTGDFTVSLWAKRQTGSGGVWDLTSYWQPLATAAGGVAWSTLPSCDSSWFHLAGVYDELTRSGTTTRTVSLYLNGAFWFSKSVASRAEAVSLLSAFGGTGGQVHDVRIWNSALTQRDIPNTRSSVMWGWDKGLIGWYLGAWDIADSADPALVWNNAYQVYNTGWLGGSLHLSTGSGGILANGIFATRMGRIEVVEGTAAVAPFAGIEMFDPDANDAALVPTRTYDVRIQISVDGGTLSAPVGASWLIGPEAVSSPLPWMSGTTVNQYRFTYTGLASSGDTATTRLRSLRYTPPASVSADIAVPLTLLVNDYKAAWNWSGNVTMVVEDTVQPVITFPTVANQTYGGSVALAATSTDTTDAITYTVSSTPVGIATLSGSTVACIGTGTVTVAASQVVSGSWNTAPTVVTRTFTVNPAPLVVTPVAATKVYGAADPVFSVTYEGFVLGDTASSLTAAPSVTRVAGEHVGDYALTASGAVAANYTITSGAANLTITPASLVVTPVTASKVYGAADPAFSVTYQGFVLGDTALSLTTAPTVTRVAGEHVGSYALTASGAASADYSIAYAGSADLTITPAPVVVTVGDQVVKRGNAPLPVRCAVSGAVAGDVVAVSSVTVTIDPAVTDGQTVGTFASALTASDIVLDSSNYTVATVVRGALTVADDTGLVQRQVWHNAPGLTIQDVPIASAPDATEDLTALALPVNTGVEYYGARIRGYVTAPADGWYTFFVAADDRADLLLSTDGNAKHKKLIASQSTWIDANDWANAARSAAVHLVQNQTVYIEVLYKQGWGGDNLSVGWWRGDNSAVVPVIGDVAIVAGDVLSPYVPKPGDDTGYVTRDIWEGLDNSSDLSTIPLHTAATRTQVLTALDVPVNTNIDNYGSRVRGYITAPVTGYYTFWIAADDQAALWLSTDDSTINKRRIAQAMVVSHYMAHEEWDQDAGQRSAEIHLIAGTSYYFEIRHKQGFGGDNLSVGWAYAATVGTAPATPSEIVPACALSPYVDEGISGAGYVTRAVWKRAEGDIPSLDFVPGANDAVTTVQTLNDLDVPVNSHVEYYFALINGTITVPKSGWYSFWMAADDKGRFTLTDGGADVVSLETSTWVASAYAWADPAAAHSGWVHLTKGAVLPFILRHAQGWGGDSMAVGWIYAADAATATAPVVEPDAADVQIVPGEVLSPVSGG